MSGLRRCNGQMAVKRKPITVAFGSALEFHRYCSVMAIIIIIIVNVWIANSQLNSELN